MHIMHVATVHASRLCKRGRDRLRRLPILTLRLAEQLAWCRFEFRFQLRIVPPRLRMPYESNWRMPQGQNHFKMMPRSRKCCAACTPGAPVAQAGTDAARTRL